MEAFLLNITNKLWHILWNVLTGVIPIILFILHLQGSYYEMLDYSYTGHLVNKQSIFWQREERRFVLFAYKNIAYQNVLGFSELRISKRKCTKQSKTFTTRRKRSGTSAGEMGGAGGKASKGTRGWSLQFLLSFKSDGTNSLPKKRANPSLISGHFSDALRKSQWTHACKKL